VRRAPDGYMWSHREHIWHIVDPGLQVSISHRDTRLMMCEDNELIPLLGEIPFEFVLCDVCRAFATQRIVEEE
jgi:hypothetical protein